MWQRRETAPEPILEAMPALKQSAGRAQAPAGGAGQGIAMATPSATPVREDDALLRVLEASIETLKAENEMLGRRLAAAEAWAAQETAKADGAIAGLRALMRLRTRVAVL